MDAHLTKSNLESCKITETTTLKRCFFLGLLVQAVKKYDPTRSSTDSFSFWESKAAVAGQNIPLLQHQTDGQIHLQQVHEIAH